MNNLYKLYPTIVLLLTCMISTAQVGINTTAPHASASLEIASDTSGVLIPRMTSAQIDAITDPAQGLMTYDTDLGLFRFFDGQWNNITSDLQERDNHVLVKSQDDFPAPLDGIIMLDTDTTYEINGTITMTSSIDMNGAIIQGKFTQRDVLFVANNQDLFVGNKGGNLRNVSIFADSTSTAARAFNLTSNPFGPDGPQNLTFQTIIINGMNEVGTITGYGLVFMDVVQFLNNKDGITFTSTGNVLLNALGWDGTNEGTYETFVGDFQLIEQQSGFMNIMDPYVGIDIVNVNSIAGSAVLSGVVFYGDSTTCVMGNSPYVGYNFTNDWTVDNPGLVPETDERATANIYLNSATAETIINNTPAKLNITTDYNRLFRTRVEDESGNFVSNRIYYDGMEGKIVTLQVALAYTATDGSQFQFALHKNSAAAPVPGSVTIANTLVTNQNQSVSILGTVEMLPGDYIEVYRRKSSTADEQFLITSFNMIMSN